MKNIMDYIEENRQGEEVEETIVCEVCGHIQETLLSYSDNYGMFTVCDKCNNTFNY